MPAQNRTLLGRDRRQKKGKAAMTYQAISAAVGRACTNYPVTMTALAGIVVLCVVVAGA